MTIQLHRDGFRKSAAVTILAVFMGVGSAAAGDKSAPASHPSPPPRAPSGPSGGAVGGGPRGGGSFTRPSAPSGSGYQRPTPSGPAQHNPAPGGGSVFTPRNMPNNDNRPAQHFSPPQNNFAPPQSNVPFFSDRAPGNGARPLVFSNQFVPRGSSEHVTSTGNTFRTRSDGRVSDLHDVQRGIDVHNGLSGNRRVMVARPDHSRMVIERGRPGFVQRPYSFHGHDFGRRTYYYNGREYHRYYRGYGYHGISLHVYAPGFYYGPGFYGWAYHTWPAPIRYGGGWYGSPLYGYYGGYFAPYPEYTSASYWLTDYLISQDLEANYAAQQAAGDIGSAPQPPADGTTELTPEIVLSARLVNA